MKPSNLFRYEQIMNVITAYIDAGTLSAGMKIPSVRQMAAQQDVSVSTVLLAYQALESKDFILSKPKSGYFVKKSAPPKFPLPDKSNFSIAATEINIWSEILQLLHASTTPNLIQLGTAIPSLELLNSSVLSKHLVRIIKSKQQTFQNYSPPLGQIPLRREISRRAINWGSNWSINNILITCGCSEALHLALRNTTLPGDTVAVESPVYFGLLKVLEALQLKAYELSVDANEGIDLDHLETVLTEGTISTCLLTSSNSNPMGFTMTNKKKVAIVNLLSKHKVPLIEDDVYGDIHFGSVRPSPFISLCPEEDIIYCSSFSKTLVPGYRIGWLYSKTRLDEIVKDKVAFTMSGPTLLQLGLASYIAGGHYERHLRRLKSITSRKAHLMAKAIEKHFPSNIKISNPKGGFVIWIQLSQEVDGRQLFQQALKKGICIAPGSIFSSTDQFGNCIRLSFGEVRDVQIEKAVSILGALLN